MSPVRSLLLAGLAALVAAAPAGAATAGRPVEAGNGVKQSTAALNAASIGHLPHRVQPTEHEDEPRPKRPSPDSPPAADGRARLRAAPRLAAVTSDTSFDGPTSLDGRAYPPDSQGDAGPSQYIVTVNGWFRSYSKATGTPDGALDLSSEDFWASVMTPVGGAITSNYTSDPRIRYDRLSGRWFAVMIDVPNGGDVTNRVMVAVSSGAVITSTTDWTFYEWSAPAGEFADYPTLGVDANALYIGTNEFSASTGVFRNTNAYVVQKSSLTGGGPIRVTAFSNLLTSASGAGPYTPQGVDNPDPSATAGYFVGVDNRSFGQLDIREVSDPGGTAPALSGDLVVSVPATSYPEDVPFLGRTGSVTLDALDDRLFAAQIRDGHLWTAHAIGVDSTGAAPAAGDPSPDRTASRWYEISLSGTPALMQSGTVYDPSSTNPRSYWIPTVAVNGQGTMAIGGSTAGAAARPDAWFSSRQTGDSPGTLAAPTRYTSATASYDPRDGTNAFINRWGDYSRTSIDPGDDQTLWTIQEYVSADNVWGVRVARLRAPPPLAATAASPATVAPGRASVTVSLSGPSGAGWFDPGSGFAKRLAVSTGCGATVTSVTYDGPTGLTLDLDTTGATGGDCSVTVTNPDGQSATATGVLDVNRAPVAAADRYLATKDTRLDGASVLANDADPDGDALTAAKVADPAHGSLALAADGTFTYTPDAGYTGADSFTYQASDGALRSATTTADITVRDPSLNGTPSAVDDSYAVPHAGTLDATTSILANDTDPDNDPLTVVNASTPARGTLTLAADGTFTYVADAGFTGGTDSFTYEASDGLASSSPATVTISAPSNTAPVANDDSYAVPSSGTLDAGTVQANDADAESDPLTSAVATGAAHGAVTMAAGGTFHYQAESGFSGTDSFTYTDSDGRESSAPAAVTLDVASPPATGSGGGGGGGGTAGTQTVPPSAITAPPGPVGPAAPQWPVAQPTTPVVAAPAFAKIRVRRAQVHKGRLDVLAQSSSRASGALEASYRSSGRTLRFTVDLAAARAAGRGPRARAAERAIRIDRRLPGALGRKSTGILELTYPGTGRVLGESVRLRVASGKALLVRREARIDSAGRLRVSGTISPRARGVVRIRMGYPSGGGKISSMDFRARIRNGRWSLTAALPPTAAAAGGQLSIQYTGYERRRIRGEQTTKQVRP